MPALVILTPGFPESEFDSNCVPFIQKLVMGLSHTAKFNRICVVTFQYPFNRSNYQWNGIEVYAAGGRNGAGIKRLITWIRVWFKLNKILKGEKAALLSIWLGEAALVGKLYAQYHGCTHYTWMPGRDGRSDNRYVKLIRPQANKLIAISQTVADELAKNHGIRGVHVVPGGIQPEEFPELHRGSREIDLLGVGNLIPLKNYRRFIHLVYELKKTHPGIKAAIVGTGPQERELLELVQQMGLQQQVSLMGAVPYHKVLGLMNNSKVFLHTSSYEGLGLVLLEALYSGCTVVSTVPLTNAPENSFHYCSTDQEILTVVNETFNSNKLPERYLYRDAGQTANEIAKVLLGHN